MRVNAMMILVADSPSESIISEDRLFIGRKPINKTNLTFEKLKKSSSFYCYIKNN